jgi:hypothetical protein
MCTSDTSPCGGATATDGDSLLPANPYTALQFHFGMLLGVDDLEVSQAYPRGKIRLHNSWLHREGVVWGFNVRLNDRNELAVAPGLALDAAGHELHLDREACVDLGKWYGKNKDDPAFTFTPAESGGVTFDVHVVARFRACLSRQVPAISAPCADGESDTAYSRAIETVELLLRPGKAPTKDLHYHRLRILFSLEPDDTTKYPEASQARADVLALALEQQPAAYLTAFRRLAALDEIDLLPQQAATGVSASIFPEDPTEVVLADVTGVFVTPGANGDFAIGTPLPTIDVTVRPSHVATATIQELLCGPLFGAAASGGDGGGGEGGGSTDPAGSGNTIRRTGPVVVDAKLLTRSIQFTVDRPLADGTLDPAAFSVTEYTDADGWSTLDVKKISVLTSGAVSVELKDAPAGKLVRFIARGTGPTPLLAKNDLVPLGAPGASGGDDGVDFVRMIPR